MRYDEIGRNVMISSTLGQPKYVAVGASSLGDVIGSGVAAGTVAAAGIVLFLGVAAGAVALVYLFKGGLWALGAAIALGGGFYLWQSVKDAEYQRSTISVRG